MIYCNAPDIPYNVHNMTKIAQTYRIAPETVLKLRFLSIGLSKPMGQIIDSLVDELWEKEKEGLTKLITTQKANKKVRSILARMRK